MACLCGHAHAQVIDTNRPGFSFTPGVVAKGRWQLETGVSYDRADDRSRSRSLPLAEARFGVAEDVEVFLSSVSWSEVETTGTRESGLVDMAIGTKVALTDANAKTRMAILFQVSVPVGDSEFSSDRYDPSAAFVWTHDGRIPLAGTVKISRFREGFQLDNGLKLPFWARGNHSAFVEWEANLHEGGEDAHWLNGAYQWLLDDRTQLDASAGIGLNGEAGDYRIAAGFSILF
jgi:hypothetical protein